MKALSVRQPWCHAILHLGKRVENRDWAGCAYRGPVLLHASKTLVLRDFDEEIESILDIVKPEPGSARLRMLADLAFCRVPLTGKRHGEGSWRPAPTLPFGGIVGQARIIGTISREPDGTERRSADSTEGRRACNEGRASPWYAGGFALVLTDVGPLPFIPFKGALGFFDVPDEVVREAVALWPAPGESRELPRRDGACGRVADWAAMGLVVVGRGVYSRPAEEPC